MSSSYVFPGGAADPGEDDLRVTAARELFEEAGVLICDRDMPAETIAPWRDKLNAGECSMNEILAQIGGGIELALDRLHYYAQWITPSVEKKRYTAVFYVAVLPAGQTPSMDNREAVDELWITPAQALERAGELRLPPPQVRTLWELGRVAERGIDAVITLANQHADHRHPIMPRLLPRGSTLTLMLPWDPEYESAGTGDLLTMPPAHPLAKGPSRFVLEDGTWQHIAAPTSPNGA